MQIIKLIIFLMAISTFGIAQQPHWIEEIPEGYLNDFYTGSASDKESRAKAQDAAYNDAIKKIINSGVIKVNYAGKFYTDAKEISSDQNIESKIIRKTIDELSIEGESRTIEGLKLVETYHDYNTGYYEAWVLVSIPKANPVSPPTSFSPVWRSVLIPGWGQFYKGQAFKGGVFLLGTASLITAAIITDGKYRDNFDKANASRQLYERDEYFDRADKWKNIRNITGIVGIALYGYNIFDSITSEGKKLYVLNVSPGRIHLAIDLNELLSY